MAVRRSTFSRDFKLEVVREVESAKSQAQVAREHQINSPMLSRWCRQHRRYKDKAFSGKGQPHNDEARIAAQIKEATVSHFARSSAQETERGFAASQGFRYTLITPYVFEQVR